jgi:heme-binding NEAT domain protein
MVHGKQAGETRTADVQLSIDSPVNIPLPSDFPQWKGPGKVEESNGQLTAQYNGNQSGNITVNPFSANAAMQAVNVVLVPENEVTHEWNFESEQLQRPQSGQAHTITHPAKVANTP